MKPRRGTVLTAFAARAGAMASSIGSASDAPTPRRNVRRGKVFLAMNMTRLENSVSVGPSAAEAEQDQRRHPVLSVRLCPSWFPLVLFVIFVVPVGDLRDRRVV